MEAHILEYIRKTGAPTSARVIARDLIQGQPKDVNPTLYKMQKQGVLVVNAEKNPPLWSVGPNPLREETKKTGDTTIDALMWSLGELNIMLGTSDFQGYMSSGNNVRRLLEVLYERIKPTGNVVTLKAVMRNDHRDKQYSAAYLKMFRQAVIDGETKIALAVAEGCDYPADLIADALQEDKEVTPFPDEAYDAVIRGVQEVSEDGFVDDYLAYRVITYYNKEELLANLILADDVELLWLVEDLTSDVLEGYIEWKYAFKGEQGRPNTPDELLELVQVLGRLPDEGDRQELYSALLEEAEQLGDDDIQRQMEGDLAYDEEEPTRRENLSRVRGYISSREQHWVGTQRDVNKILFPIGRVEGALDDVKRNVDRIIAGRYKYLPQ